MLNRNVVLAVACAGILVACGQSEGSEFPDADIANVSKVKSNFGPEYKVSDVPPTGIDPKLLAPQKFRRE